MKTKVTPKSSATRLNITPSFTFDGARIQYVEKQFIETLGKSGASGLNELFSQNDERAKAIIHDGQTVLTLRSLILSNRWEHFWTFFVNRHFPEFGT